MPRIEIPRARQLAPIQYRKPRDFTQEILAVDSQNPLATAISTIGDVVGKTLTKRAELRRQGQLLAQAKAEKDAQFEKQASLQRELAQLKQPNYVIPTLDQAGNVTGYDQVPQGFKPTPFAKPPLPVKASQPTGAQNKSIADVQGIDEQLNQIDFLESKLNQGMAGPIAGRLGMAGAKLTGGGVQQPISEFEAIKPAFAVKVYRAWTGDTRLSDADAAARAYPLIPSPTDAPQVQKAKWNNIRGLLQAKREQLAPTQLNGLREMSSPALSSFPTNTIKTRTGKRVMIQNITVTP